MPPEYGEVFDVKRRMTALGARNAVMSGSGPTVCGLFADAATARAAADTLRAEYPATFYAVPVPPVE